MTTTTTSSTRKPHIIPRPANGVFVSTYGSFGNGAGTDIIRTAANTK